MKRLLPAYLATACVVLIVSFFRFLPHERIHAVEQFLSSTLFTSNVTYWLGNQYFSASELRPTLSFWSLALEIQFYLIFPVLFWIFFRNYKISSFCSIFNQLRANVRKSLSFGKNQFIYLGYTFSCDSWRLFIKRSWSFWRTQWWFCKTFD